LGGCPYAKKSVGNVPTENVVEMLSMLGIQTGIDLIELKKLGQFYAKEFGREIEYLEFQC